MEVLPEELPPHAGLRGRDVGLPGHGHRGGSRGTSCGGQQDRDSQGHPLVLHVPQAVIKGDTASLRKDSQSPLNL